MKALERHLVAGHTLTKVGLYLQSLSLAIWGPLGACVAVAVACFGILLLTPGRRGTVANPFYALILCAVAVLLVVPGGTAQEIIAASELSTRILSVMLASALLGAVITPSDVLLLQRFFRLPRSFEMVALAMVLFVPRALDSIRSVVYAQRSRGLDLSVVSVFRPSTYRLVLVPYIVSVLKAALTLWVSLNLRPSLAQSSESMTPIQAVILVASGGLWLM